MSGIEALFPGLRGSHYALTSPADDRYNCIAWAAGATDRWWWPGDPPMTWWPQGVQRSETLEAFREAFARLGFAPCDSLEPEPGVERIALFADSDGFPTHAARQLPNGRWTSKLGRLQDVEHALRDIEGNVYGQVALLMKRQAPSRVLATEPTA